MLVAEGWTYIARTGTRPAAMVPAHKRQSARKWGNGPGEPFQLGLRVRLLPLVSSSLAFARIGVLRLTSHSSQQAVQPFDGLLHTPIPLYVLTSEGTGFLEPVLVG